MFFRRRDKDLEAELSRLKQNFAELATQFAMMQTNMNSLRGLINRKLGTSDKIRGIENEGTPDMEEIKKMFGGELPFELVRDEINKKQSELHS